MTGGVRVRRPTDELICEVGDQVEIAGTFANIDGTPTNPTHIYLTIGAPDGRVRMVQFGVDADFVNPSPGVFRLEYVPVQGGRYYWRMWGEGVVNRTHIGTIIVQDDPNRRTISGSGIAAVRQVTATATGGVA